MKHIIREEEKICVVALALNTLSKWREGRALSLLNGKFALFTYVYARKDKLRFFCTTEIDLFKKKNGSGYRTLNFFVSSPFALLSNYIKEFCNFASLERKRHSNFFLNELVQPCNFFLFLSTFSCYYYYYLFPVFNDQK